MFLFFLFFFFLFVFFFFFFLLFFFFFFFQAEDGIRVWSVTGVQTCALPISGLGGQIDRDLVDLPAETGDLAVQLVDDPIRALLLLLDVDDFVGQRVRLGEIGRASCRGRGGGWGGVGSGVVRSVWMCEWDSG